MKEKAILCHLNTLKEEGCFDFLHPVIKNDVQDIVKKVNQGQTGARNILSGTAIKDMESLLLGRFHILYAGIMIMCLNSRLKNYDFLQAVMPPEEKTGEMITAARDLKKELDASGRDELYAEYELLSGYEEKIRRNYKDHMLEMLSRFSAAEAEIAGRFFGGKIPEKIIGMEASGADMHRRGRTVVHLITDAGDCYYKPHDCSLDEFYKTIVDKWFPDCTMAPSVIKGENHAFISSLKKSGLDAETDKEAAAHASKYYHNFGALAALLHGLGSNDMHAENILPCGDRPCIVDMESVVSTKKRSDIQKTDDPDKKEKGLTGLEASVIHVGFLPVRIHKGDQISPLYHGVFSEERLAFYQDKKYTLEGYEEDFIEGFKEGYGRMMEHREEIAKLLGAYNKAVVRIIPFNTMYYTMCRARLFSREALGSREVTGKVLSGLDIPFRWRGMRDEKKLHQYEEAALCEGDIPYFCTPVYSHDLFANTTNEPVKKDYLEFSAEEYTMRSLERLSDNDLAFEVEVLRKCFLHAPLDVEVVDEEKECNIQNSEPYSSNAKEIFKQMAADRIYTDDGRMVWISFAGTVRYGGGYIAQLAGALIFACRLRSAGCNEELCAETDRLIEECVESIKKTVEDLGDFKAGKMRSQISLGIASGLGLVFVGLGQVALSGRYKVVHIIDTLLDVLAEKEVWKTDRVDFTDGLSGLLVGMLICIRAVRRIGGEEGKTELINETVSRISERISETEANGADAFFGKAGIGLAMAEAFRYTGKALYLKKALMEFSAVKEQYSEHLSGWPEDDRLLSWTSGKSRRSAAIGLCALRAIRALNECRGYDTADALPLDDVFELALDSVLGEKMLYWNDSLSGGNAMNVLFLAEAARHTGKRDVSDRAGAILAAMEQRSEKCGYYHLMDEGVRSYFDISFSEGSVGIGYTMLIYDEVIKEEKRISK